MSENENLPNFWTRVSMLATILLLSVPVVSATAGQFNPVAPLLNERTEIVRVAAGETVGTASIFVEQCTLIQVESVATTDVTLKIIAPDGTEISAATADSIGASVLSFTADSQEPFLAGSLMRRPGFHTHVTTPSFGPGNYSFEFELTSPAASDVPILIALRTDSRIAAALTATAQDIAPGEATVFVSYVAEQGDPIIGAGVLLSLLAPDGSTGELTMLDNGALADGIANDGVYSVAFVPDQVGEYLGLATITGNSADGSPFIREAQIALNVVPVLGRIAGVVDDIASDTDGDGTYDQISIKVEIEILLAGLYDVRAELRSNTGHVVSAAGPLSFLAGTRTVSVDFTRAAVLRLQEDGPYDISFVELELVEIDSRQKAHRATAVGSTRRYSQLHFVDGQDGSISGVVRNAESAEPAAGVNVTIFDVNATLVARVSTDETGSFSTDFTLHAGHYFAASENSLGLRDEIYNNVGCDALCPVPDRIGSPILVESGLRSSTVVFELQPK